MGDPYTSKIPKSIDVEAYYILHSPRLANRVIIHDICTSYTLPLARRDDASSIPSQLSDLGADIDQLRRRGRRQKKAEALSSAPVL